MNNLALRSKNLKAKTRKNRQKESRIPKMEKLVRSMFGLDYDNDSDYAEIKSIERKIIKLCGRVPEQSCFGCVELIERSTWGIKLRKAIGWKRARKAMVKHIARYLLGIAK
jgi:hypothetical protein